MAGRRPLRNLGRALGAAAALVVVALALLGASAMLAGPAAAATVCGEPKDEGGLWAFAPNQRIDVQVDGEVIEVRFAGTNDAFTGYIGRIEATDTKITFFDEDIVGDARPSCWQRPLDEHLGDTSDPTGGTAPKSSYAESTGSTMKDTLGSFIFGSCWLCTFLAAAVFAGDGFGRQAYALFAGGITGVLGYLLVLWVMLQATRLIYPAVNDNPARVLWTLLTRSLGIVLVSSLLQVPLSSGGTGQNGAVTFFDWGPEVVIASGAGLASGISQRMVEAADSELAAFAGGQGCGGWNEDVLSQANIFGSDNLSATSIDDATLQKLTCMAHQVQIAGGVGLAIAGEMIDTTELTSPNTWLFRFLPAVLLYGVFGIAVVAFIFYILDALIRIVVMGALAPVLMALALFKPTRDMATGGLRVMISGGATLLGLSMVFGLTLAMLSAAPQLIEFPPPDGGTRTITALITAMESNELNRYFSYFDLFEGGYWFVLFTGILLLKLMRRVGALIKTVLNTAAQDPDSMGAGAQRLLGGMARTAVYGTGGMMLGAAISPAAGAAGAAGAAMGGGNLGNAAMAARGPTRTSRIMGRYRMLARQFGNNRDEDLET